MFLRVERPRLGGRLLVSSVLVMLTATMLTATMLAAGDAGAAPTWTVSTLPTATPVQAHAAFRAVSCPSTTYCLAVGSHVAVDGRLALLAEVWNGTKWSVVTQSVPGSGADALTAVSCASRTYCVATTSGTSARPLRWNGTTWSIQSIGSTHVDYLSDVACRSRSNCSLIGSIGQQAVSWRWNGSVWHRVTVAYPRRRSLDSVSCPSHAVCYAGGTINSNSRAFVARYDGTSWSASALPKIDGSIDDITCTSTTKCTAVGSRGSNAQRVLVADLFGGKWHYSSIKTTKGDPSGSRVACTAAGTCTVIMTYYSNSDAIANAIAVRPKGGVFNVSRKGYPDLSGLSCTGASCTVVGSTLVFDRGGLTIADQPTPATAYRRSGTALVTQAVPQPDGRAGNELDGVSCAGAGTCAAIGGVEDPTALWLRPGTGAAWQPVAGSGGKTYTGVSCSSATFCMAVGTGTSRSYNGTSWATHAIPQPDGTSNDDIFGVSCVSSTWCDAVGTTGADGRENRVLVVHWNGSGWARVAAPTPADIWALASISCTATDACLAVGYGYGADSERPLAERWNGTSWTIVSDSGLPATAGLHAVSCWSATGCMVTSPGDYGDAAVATWDGSSFTSHPVVGDQPTVEGVSCTSATSCTAVGVYFGVNRFGSQLVEHWDGSGWHIVATPLVIGDQPRFNGVSCASTDGRCSAVGAVGRAYNIALTASGTVS